MNTRTLIFHRVIGFGAVGLSALSLWAQPDGPKGPPPPNPAKDPKASPPINYPANPNINPPLDQHRSTPGYANSSGESSQAASSLDGKDRRFLTDTLERLPEEVKIAKLGIARARNPAVKAFAERRMKENAEWDRELNALAVAKKFGLPKADRERRFENLLEKPGQVFDREFVDAQKASLKTMNEWFKEAASEAKDPDVRALAEKLSRTTEQSRAEAERLESQLHGKE